MARLLEALDGHLAGLPTPRPLLLIAVVDADALRYNQEDYEGYWWNPRALDGHRRIWVVAGDQDELPALYHELNHDRFDDGRHEPPDVWRSIDAEGARRVQQLGRK